MLRLIQVDVATTGKAHLRNGTPSLVLNFRALDILLRQGSHFGFQIVAHQIEFVDTVLLARVERGFCRRQRKDQPAMPRIHGLEAQDVAEKCAVRLSVFAVDNDVSARNHFAPPNKYAPECLAGPHVSSSLEKRAQTEVRALSIGEETLNSIA